MSPRTKKPPIVAREPNGRTKALLMAAMRSLDEKFFSVPEGRHEVEGLLFPGGRNKPRGRTVIRGVRRWVTFTEVRGLYAATLSDMVPEATVQELGWMLNTTPSTISVWRTIGRDLIDEGVVL